jgi:hypothetical protein
MPDIPFGFSFDQTDDGFVLRNKTDDRTTEIKMSAEQLQGLKAQIDLWLDRRLLSLQVEGRMAQAIAVHWVAKVDVLSDELRNVVLAVQGSSGGEMNLALPLHVAIPLAVTLAGLVQRLTAESPTKQ